MVAGPLQAFAQWAPSLSAAFPSKVADLELRYPRADHAPARANEGTNCQLFERVLEHLRHFWPSQQPHLSGGATSKHTAQVLVALRRLRGELMSLKDTTPAQAQNCDRFQCM